ncbi:MAG: hypothetical protein KKB50_15585 [Planctomycetes bacterium]|nr:hypothetical protein [Planctomycetota bacterium]
MSRKPARLKACAATLLVVAMLTGGCLPIPEDLTLAPQEPVAASPGTYWLDQQDGELFYFEFPPQRGTGGRWMLLDETVGDWFTGPGFYELSEDLSWSRDPDWDGVTLDEVMQLYDPPPAVDL